MSSPYLEYTKIKPTRFQSTLEDSNLEYFDAQRVTPLSANEAILFVDSKNKEFGTISDFRVNFGQELPNIKKIGLLAFQCPAIPTIHARNDTITGTFVGVAFTAVIDHGFYNYVSFASALKQALDDATGGLFTVTPMAQTGGYSIVSASIFKFTGGSFTIQGKYVVPLPISAVEDSGFLTGIAYMLPTRYILLKSRQLVAYNKIPTLNSGKDPHVVGVFNYSPTNNQQQTLYKNDVVNYVNWNTRANFSSVDIQIVDEFRNTLAEIIDTTFTDSLGDVYDLPQNSEICAWLIVQV